MGGELASGCTSARRKLKRVREAATGGKLRFIAAGGVSRRIPKADFSRLMGIRQPGGRRIFLCALRDDQWCRTGDMQPGREGHAGATAPDNRLFVDPIIYLYRTSSRWRGPRRAALSLLIGKPLHTFPEAL